MNGKCDPIRNRSKKSFRFLKKRDRFTMGWEQTKMRQKEEMITLNFDLKSAKVVFFLYQHTIDN